MTLKLKQLCTKYIADYNPPKDRIKYYKYIKANIALMAMLLKIIGDS